MKKMQDVLEKSEESFSYLYNLHTLVSSAESNPFYIFKVYFALQKIYSQGEYVMCSYAIDSTSLPTQATQGQH